MGFFSIIVPEAATNLILNPSAETTGNFGDHNGGTTTRVTTYARFGTYCYQVATGAVNRGMTLTVGALANAIHYCTFYARGNAAATLQVSADNVNWNAATAIGGATGGWVRYGVSLPAAQCNGSTTIRIRNTANETFYVDAVQLEANSYYTTYLDGDQGPLFRWTGLRHASTSTRDAQERLGGRERDFDDYAIYPKRDYSGLGVPQIVNNLQAMALQPGAIFQSNKVQPRVMALTLDMEGSSFALMHSKRQDLWDLIKPDLVRGNQPFTIGYSGANSGKKAYGQFRYDDGMGFSGPEGFAEDVPVRLLAVDPYWYEDNRETAGLDFQDSIAAATRVLQRKNGQWQAMGTGVNNAVSCIAVDYQRGRVYFGGQFTLANGVTVNGICYWDGTTFVAMGATPGIAGGASNTVKTIAIAANGDVWVGGDFTSAGGVAADGLARWNIATGTWTQFVNGTAGDIIYALVLDSAGNLYGAGNFINWDGIAAADYIWKYNGSAFSALGTSPFASTNFPESHQALVVDASGNLWAGERYNTGLAGTASVRKWNGTTWTTIITTDSLVDASIHALYFDSNGTLYIGGLFTTLGGIAAANVAQYNGSTVSPLGTGVNSYVYRFLKLDEGLLVGGNFTSAGGLSLADRLSLWNGSTWTHMDVDLPGAPIPYGLAYAQRTLFVGFTTTGAATVAGLTTVTPASSTLTYPVCTLVGPSSGSCVLQWLENQSSGQRLYFSLTVLAGETVTISLLPGLKQVTSDWRGVIYQQPLANSDFANWHLLPGANIIAAFITGTTTAAALLAHWTPRHLSVDGVAA